MDAANSQPRSRWRGTLPRLAFCGLLLAWIFQAIFWSEGKRAWEQHQQTPRWDQLTRVQRLEASWKHGPRELWESVSAIRTGPLLLSLVVMGATIGLGVVRWRLVLRVQGLDLSFARALEISIVAHFFNSFLLGATGGDLIKAYYAARETHHKKAEAVGTVFVDRIIGLFALLLFTCAMMAVNLPLLRASPLFQKLAWIIVAMTLGGALVTFLAFRGGVSKGLPRAREWLRRLPHGEFLERLRDSFRPFGHDHPFLLQSFAISMLLWGVCVLHVQTLAWGLGLKVTWVQLLAIVPMITCFVVLPLTPSGLGIRENGFVFLLAVPQIGDDHTTALSLSLLCYAGSLFWSLIGGVVYATFRGKHHLTEIAHADENGNAAG